MEAIRSWWEVPCIAHFCHIFSKPFKLPNFEIEELEDTLLLDEPKDDPTPSLLVKLYCIILNGIVDKEVTEENWEFFLKMHMQWRYDYLEEKFNPHDGKTYKELCTRTKVEILNRMCHWRLELDDIGELLRGLDGSLLRVEPVGSDEEGNVYWYFYGTRLYMELGKKKKRTTNAENTPNKGKNSRGKGKNNTLGKPGRKRNKEEPEKAESTPPPSEASDWRIVCSTAEEWEDLIDKLRPSKKTETRRLCNYLNDELLPDILYLIQQKEKIFKRKLLAELPRRISDRIAQKAIKEEEDRMDALRREIQREEQRKEEEEERVQMEEEADKKHQEKLEEVIKRRKAREEKQKQQRQKEEQKWSLALSGELSGPRKAAIGAVQGVVQTQQELLQDKDEDLYTDMYKVLSGLRKQEDSWIFEEPVTEDIAPGYFEVVNTPMDFQTVEKKMETGQYTTREQFGVDLEMIFNNCKDYNGEDSEYHELADTMLELCGKLMKQIKQTDPLLDEDEEGGGKRKKKKSLSPDLTSESSEESSEDEGVDENEEEEGDGKRSKKKKSSRGIKEGGLMFKPQMVQPTHPGMFRQMPPHMMHPHMRPPPEMMGGAGGYPPHPYYGGQPMRPHYPNHPMQMRPHPREPYPSEHYRYPPYMMNGSMPPPAYGPPMMNPEQQMMHHQRMMAQHSYPMNGSGPPMMMSSHPGPPMMMSSHPGPRMPGQPPANQEAPPTTKEGGNQRVSSPRVSSTVKTPPTSGDEKTGNNDECKEGANEEDKPNAEGNNETPKELDKPPQTNGPPASNAPPTQSPYPSGQPHPSYPPHYMQQMRGLHPTQAMMDERQRYMHAMMMMRRQQQQYMMAQGYPPQGHPSEDPYYNRQQRPALPPYGPHPSQGNMMDEKQKYMEYQMRVRNAAAAASGSPGPMPRPQAPPFVPSPQPGKDQPQKQPSENNSDKEPEKKEREEGEGGNSKEEGGTNDKSNEGDIPDYHDSLTRYARELATKEEEGKGKSEETNDTKEDNTPRPRPPSHESIVNGQPRPPPPQSRPGWPHPSNPGHMMPNGYEGHMMSSYGHMMPPQQMYGQGSHSNMPYNPYQDTNAQYVMSPEMEQWRYMEMQRQWMAARQHQQQMTSYHQPHPQSKGLKRPLPNKPTPFANNNHVAGSNRVSKSNNESDPTGEPTAKQPKLTQEAENDKEEPEKMDASEKNVSLESKTAAVETADN